jgi:hypothetical protein
MSMLKSAPQAASFATTALVCVALGAGASTRAQEREVPGTFVALENGDTNGDWELDLSDAVYLLSHLFLGGPAPAPLACGAGASASPNGDTNGDGALDLSDAIHHLYWLYLGGRELSPVRCDLADLADAGEGQEIGGGQASEAVQRPIAEFVSAQGTFCIDDGAGGCFLFVPPTPNFLGQSDPQAGICSSVDYAGLADAWAGGIFGTTTSGSITERPLADGRAEVHVRLRTDNALTWVIDGCADFSNHNLLFGHRAPDVVNDGASAALGASLWNIVFVNPAPGHPMPDLLQLFIAPEPGQEVRMLSFYARARGELREAFGVADGTPGFFETSQTGLLMTAFMGATGDAFPVENIVLRAVGN